MATGKVRHGSRELERCGELICPPSPETQFLSFVRDTASDRTNFYTQDEKTAVTLETDSGEGDTGTVINGALVPLSTFPELLIDVPVLLRLNKMCVCPEVHVPELLIDDLCCRRVCPVGIPDSQGNCGRILGLRSW